MVKAGMIRTLVDMDSILVAGNVVLTSTVEVDGRQYACEAEVVTFTCQEVRSVFLKWDSPFIHQTPIVFFVSGFTALVSTSRPHFIATLTSIAGIGLSTNFTSTLQVNASRKFAKNYTNYTKHKLYVYKNSTGFINIDFGFMKKEGCKQRADL